MATARSASVQQVDATAERAKGKDHKAWFLIGSDTVRPTLLEGQSANSENMDNATQTVAPLKTDDPNANTGVVYQGRIDGVRDLTGTVSFARLKDVAKSKVQVALINKLRHASDTTTLMFFGSVEYTDVEGVQTPKFTGYKTYVLIKGGSIDYPVESEVSGTINWENKGGEPIEIVGKTWTDAISQTTSDAIV